jgi:hypothetical protein
MFAGMLGQYKQKLKIGSDTRRLHTLNFCQIMALGVWKSWSYMPLWMGDNNGPENPHNRCCSWLINKGDN